MAISRYSGNDSVRLIGSANVVEGKVDFLWYENEYK